MKETLKIQYYLRYTDDFVMVDSDPERLLALLPQIKSFLHHSLVLELHPNKIILRKLRQGIDFLGYIVLPHYRVVRTKTKQRMFKKIYQPHSASSSQIQSYLGMLQQCDGYELSNYLRRIEINRLANRNRT